MKRHNPEVYNLTTNPSLPKTNSVGAFMLIFVSLALLMMAAIYWFPRPFRLSVPVITYFPDHLTVSATALNNTDRATTAIIEVRLLISPIPRQDAPLFTAAGSREVSVTVPPHSTSEVVVAFPFNQSFTPNRAEMEILSRK